MNGTLTVSTPSSTRVDSGVDWRFGLCAPPSVDRQTASSGVSLEIDQRQRIASSHAATGAERLAVDMSVGGCCGERTLVFEKHKMMYFYFC